MNIIDALKSGRRFRRRGGFFWLCKGMILPDGTYLIRFHVDDILADDWEIEPEVEEKIAITKQQLFSAMFDYERGLETSNMVAKKLGFK